MKKQQLDHVLRAAARITGENRFLVIGNQSLHGKYPDLPDDIAFSAEVDLIAGEHVDRTEWLNVIGQDSPFHESFGYYADPVDETTATLPSGWKDRMVRLSSGDTEGVEAYRLDTHDLAIAKYVARREKDRVFTRGLARRRLVMRKRLLDLLKETPVSEEVRDRIQEDIRRDFERNQLQVVRAR
jgi:hypothetical protein